MVKKIKQIQFDRVVGFTGSFNEAVKNIKEKVTLLPGEPLVCSYRENGVDSFFLAIGTIFQGAPKIKVFPAFDDFTDFENFVKSKCGSDVSFDFKNSISEESDIAISEDSDGKYVLKIKGEVSPSKWEELPDKR